MREAIFFQMSEDVDRRGEGGGSVSQRTTIVIAAAGRSALCAFNDTRN
jgi:hypothetical protein